MKAADLVYRGYAKREGALWVAVCLDFCLAAQADTAEEATQKLSRQIQDYIYDAIAGEDREQGEHFLRHRKAPLRHWLTYCRFRALHALHLLSHEAARLLHHPLPLPMARPA